MFANAEAYERFMGRWSRLLAPLLLEFANIPDGARVLEVGSGTGSLSLEIAARLPHSHILGIDPSEAFVAFSRTRFTNPRVLFEVGDAQDLSSSAAAFDACLSLLVFNFLPDPRAVLAVLRRVTRPGGRICAATWDYGDRMRMLRIFWDAATALDDSAEHNDERHMPLCRAGELNSLWQESGLVEVQEVPLEIVMRFSSFADFWEPFLTAQGPAGAYVARLSPKRCTALCEEVKRLLPEEALHGAFELRARAWAVRGSVPLP
jgi:SAM-dependent methyltransferase